MNVQALSLDNWTVQFALERIRALKIDAEGSELTIVKGA